MAVVTYADVSVVVPVYMNAGTVEALHARIAAALGPRLREVIYVEDGSPDASADLIARLASRDSRAVLVRRAVNAGQQRALIEGLRHATGEWAVTIDADLQDPPEAIPVLLEEDAPVVFAARRGRYERSGRLLTSRAFKRTLGALTGLPGEASCFVSLRRDVVAEVLRLTGPPPFLPAMIAATGAEAAIVPVERERSRTRSGYSGLARLGSATNGLQWAARNRRVAGREIHNAAQRNYYAAHQSARIQPRPTRYARRQVQEAIAFAGLDPGSRVLDVGCGLGRATLQLAEAGLDVEGMDLSPALLAELRARPEASGIALHEGELASPPAHLHGAFHAVCGFFVLHHVYDLVASLAGVRQMLKPGGHAVFVEPNALCPLFYLQVGFSRGMSFRIDGGLVRMQPKSLRRACSHAGLEQVDQTTFGLLPPALVNRPWGALLEAALEPPSGPVRAFRMFTARRAASG